MPIPSPKTAQPSPLNQLGSEPDSALHVYHKGLPRLGDHLFEVSPVGDPAAAELCLAVPRLGAKPRPALAGSPTSARSSATPTGSGAPSKAPAPSVDGYRVI